MALRVFKSLILAGLFATFIYFAVVLPSQAAGLDARRVVINVPARALYLYDGPKVVRTFPVGVGRAAFPTPEGHYSVVNKILQPAWENPYKAPGKQRVAAGYNNPLGTRWIGFLEADGGEYGIHGTNEPGSVGKFVSHGCVRMHIKDAEELFDLVDYGTPVDVVYDLAFVDREGDQIKLTLYPDVFRRGLPSAGDLKSLIQRKYPGAKVDENGLKYAVEKMTTSSLTVATAEPKAEDVDASVVTFKLRITN